VGGLVKLNIMLGSTPVVVMVEAKEDVSLKLGVGCELIAGVVQKSAAWSGRPKEADKSCCGGGADMSGVCHCANPGLIRCGGPKTSCCELIIASLAKENEGLWVFHENR
jgi:hypothetical protein